MVFCLGVCGLPSRGWDATCFQLLLNLDKVTCAEPAHIAPRLVQKTRKNTAQTNKKATKHQKQNQNTQNLPPPCLEPRTAVPTMVERRAGSSHNRREGIELTLFAEEICLQEDLEVSLVCLPVTVQEISFPMCLVSGKCSKSQCGTSAHEGIPAWPLHQVPQAVTLCRVEMPSGESVSPAAAQGKLSAIGGCSRGLQSVRLDT